MPQNQELEERIRTLLASHGVELFSALPAENMPGFEVRVMNRARTLGKEEEVRQWVEEISRPRAVHPWVRTVLLFGCNTNDQFAQPDRAPSTPYGRVGRWLVYLSRLWTVAEQVISVGKLCRTAACEQIEVAGFVSPAGYPVRETKGDQVADFTIVGLFFPSWGQRLQPTVCLLDR